MADLAVHEAKGSKIFLVQYPTEGSPVAFRYRVKKLVNRMKPYIGTTLDREQVEGLMTDPLTSIEIS